MATLKTRLTNNSVTDFLDNVDNEQKRTDCFAIVAIMQTITNAPAKMWGSAIIGFGDYKYYYPDGRAMDWFMMGFSPRKQNLALYILGCGEEEKPQILSRIGKYKTGKSCIYINKLSDVDLDVFKELCKSGMKNLKSYKL